MEARRANDIIHLVAQKKLPTETITDERIINAFGDAEIAELTWKHALLMVGDQYGLADDTGRPKNEWARRVVAKAEKVHRNTRRAHLRDKRLHSIAEPTTAAARLRSVSLRLFNGAEMFLACRPPGLNNLEFVAHERRAAMPCCVMLNSRRYLPHRSHC